MAFAAADRAAAVALPDAGNFVLGVARVVLLVEAFFAAALEAGLALAWRLTAGAFTGEVVVAFLEVATALLAVFVVEGFFAAAFFAAGLVAALAVAFFAVAFFAATFLAGVFLFAVFTDAGGFLLLEAESGVCFLAAFEEAFFLPVAILINSLSIFATLYR